MTRRGLAAERTAPVQSTTVHDLGTSASLESAIRYETAGPLNRAKVRFWDREGWPWRKNLT